MMKECISCGFDEETLTSEYCTVCREDFQYKAEMDAWESHLMPCTCPSGDGSLRWPCPSHPPVDTDPETR